MTVPPLAVHVQLQELRYLGGGERSAEPYVWVVFFKVDGDTAALNEMQNLGGSATTAVAPRTPDLPEGMRPGDRVEIPEGVGSYRTVLRPIPMAVPIAPRDSVAGLIGYVCVLWEADNTPLDARVHGPVFLKHALQRELDELIPTLGMAHPQPSREEIDALAARVAGAVEAAIKDRINFLDVASGGFDVDDQCGELFETFDSEQLSRDGPVIQIRSGREIIDVVDPFGEPIGKAEVSVLRGDGEWEINGRVTAIPFSLRSFFAVTGLNPAEGVRGLLARIPLDPFAARPAARSIRLLFEKLI